MNVLKSPWNVHWYFGCFLFANSLHHPQAHWLHMGVSPRCNWPLFIHTGVSKVAVCRVKVRRSQERRAKGEPQNIRGDVGFESKMIFPWIFLGWFLGEAYGSYQGWTSIRLFFTVRNWPTQYLRIRNWNIRGLTTKRNLQDFYTGFVLILHTYRFASQENQLCIYRSSELLPFLKGSPLLCLVKGEVPEDPRIDAANYVNRAPIPAFHFLRFLTAKKRMF